MDKAMELFYNLPEKEFRFQEKKSYKICKREFDKFFSSYYKTLSLEERYKIDDYMTEFCEYINNDIVLMDQAFQSLVMFLDTDKRIIVSNIYTINTIVECTCRIIQSMKTKQVDVAPIDINLYKMQKAYFTRVYPFKCLINPNQDQNIKRAVEGFIHNTLNYRIN